MSDLSYRTSGESHGSAVMALVEGMPFGLKVDVEQINSELHRRQGGFGRSARQQIERDSVEIRSGVRRGLTIGSPIILEIANRDQRLDDTPAVTRPRPGHADFAGSVKWLTTDCRETLERASARETAARVAAGALAKGLLKPMGIVVGAFVRQIGSVKCQIDSRLELAELLFRRDDNEVYCPDPVAAAQMMEAIRTARGNRDTLGGVLEIRAEGAPPGLGSCLRYQDKLDGRMMMALGSIQAIKAVEIGMGFAVADHPGSEVHDEMDFDPEQRSSPNLGFVRRSNHAGGIEGGMTNGQPIVLRAAMKPISTLLRGLDTVDLTTRTSARTAYERSDFCAVPAASVVAENVIAFELARAVREKFAGDTMLEMLQAHEFYLHSARRLGLERAANRQPDA